MHDGIRYGIMKTELNFAGMVELADTLDLGSSIARCAGSSPVARTIGNVEAFEPLSFLPTRKERRITMENENILIFPTDSSGLVWRSSFRKPCRSPGFPWSFC